MDSFHRSDLAEPGPGVGVEHIDLAAVGDVQAPHGRVDPQVVVPDVTSNGKVGDDPVIGRGGGNGCEKERERKHVAVAKDDGILLEFNPMQHWVTLHFGNGKG